MSDVDPSRTKQPLATWIVLNITVFVAAACIMTVEILSTRMVAQYLGSSLYTWTTAIGVVLGGISLGNFLGGRLADRFHPRRTLALLFVLSSVACLSIPFVNHVVGDGTALDEFSWPVRIFLHYLVTFLVPATLLGTMGPIVAKMALDLDLATGRTIGSLYAWGSIGSIFGTFLAGFFLIAWFGTETSILWVSGILALMGILYGYRAWYPYAGSALVLLMTWVALTSSPGVASVGVALGWRNDVDPDVLMDEDTQYQRVRILKDGTFRTMILDVLLHSRIDLADPLDLIYGYEQIYAAVLAESHPPTRKLNVMFIGGGGYVFPQYVERVYPQSRIEVSEIDPVVTDAAFRWFGVGEDSKIECHDMDGRNRVADLIRKKRSGKPVAEFDYIFGDAFNDFSIPFHLTTREFNQMIDELLADDGIYMLNLIETWSVAEFLSAVVYCLRDVFREVYVISATSNMTRRNTFVVLCSQQPVKIAAIERALRRTRSFTGHVLSEEEMSRLARINGDRLLTDDYAPVENLLLETIRRRVAIDSLEVIHQVEALLESGQLEDAKEALENALEKLPHDPELINKYGFVAIRLGDFVSARDAFEQVVEYDPRNRTHRSNLGLAYEQLGNHAEAVAQYAHAVELEPDHVPTVNALADLLATSADPEVRDGRRALRHAKRALELTNGHPRVLLTVATAHAAGSDYKAAVKACETALGRANEGELEELAAEIQRRLDLFKDEKPCIRE